MNNMEKDTFKTRTTRFHLDEQGILYMAIEGNPEMVLEDAIENMNMIKELVPKMPRLLLTDIRNVKSTSKAYRDYFSQDEQQKEISVLAVLVGSPVSKIMGNLFLSINKPTYPMKLFSEETEAIKWLQEMVGKL